jgi:ketosteroid isomerase-like protein
MRRIRRLYADFHRGDLTAFLEALDPDVEWTEPPELPYGGTFYGPAAVGDLLRTFAIHYEAFAVEPETMLDAGDHVVVLGRYRGRAVGGMDFEAPFAHVWQLGRDGQVVRYRDYTDKAGKAFSRPPARPTESV